jgi:hypothetical protein
MMRLPRRGSQLLARAAIHTKAQVSPLQGAPQRPCASRVLGTSRSAY